MNVTSYSVGAASAVVGTLLLFASTPFWWIGSGLVAGGAAVVVWAARDEISAGIEWLREPREVRGVEFVPAVLLAELLCIAVLAALNVAMLPNVTLGDRPVDHDHTVHFFKAWQLEQEFLAEGRLYGWSHRWFGGYPAQYLYPIGADVLVVAIHALTLGFADLGTAYAWAIWLFWFVGGYAVYRFGANAFGRWGGLLAGILFMTDMGAFRIGGWAFGVIWGVWPMSLSTVLVVAAMACVPRLMDGERWRDVAIFGLLMGGALVTHPFSLIHLAFALVVALFAFWVAETDRHWLVGAGRLGAGATVGGLIGALWLVPFFAAKDFMDPHFGGAWSNLLKIGRGFYHLNFLPGTWSLATAFGVVGMLALLWSRKFEHVLIGMLTLAFIVCGSRDFLAGFNFLEIFGSFQRVHFKRFITILKPYFLLGTAYGIVAVVRHTAPRVVRLVRHEVSEDEGGWEGLQPVAKRWMRFVVVFLCLVPLALPFFDAFGANHFNRRVTNASERPFRRARVEAAEWFREKFPEGEPFFRVATNLGRHDHRLVDFGRRIPFPVYKIGYTPATSFLYRYEEGKPELLNRLNVRYALTPGGPPRGAFEKVKSFRALNLYENQDWQKQPFEILEGSGPVELVRWDDEEIVVRAKEGAEGRLRLSVSHFDRWAAYRDGERVELTASEIDLGSPNGFMTVDLEPGTYRFAYRRGFAERAAFVLFFLGLLLVVAFLLADTRNRYGELVARRLDRVQAAATKFTASRRVPLDAAGAAGAAMLVVLGCVLAWVRPPLQISGRDFGEKIEEVHYDFGHELRHATVRIRKGEERTEPCRAMLGYFVCGRADWKSVHHRVEDFGHELSMTRCIWSHPLPKGPLEIRFSDVPAGEALVGYYGVPESGSTTRSKPVELEVGYGGVYRHTGTAGRKEELDTFEVPVAPKHRGTRVDVSFRVSAENTGQRHFCFNAQMVDVRGEPGSDESGGSASDGTD